MIPCTTISLATTLRETRSFPLNFLPVTPFFESISELLFHSSHLSTPIHIGLLCYLLQLLKSNHVVDSDH